jgi:hypothetical protein
VSTKAKIITWLIVAAVAVGIGGFFLIRHLSRAAVLDPFNAKINDYINVAPKQRADPGPPALKGKVIPVDLGEKAVDWLYFDLPDDLRPTTPEEVGTVVHLRWGQIQVGQYGTGGGAAYVQTCKVTVLDKASGVVLGETEVRGSQPPQSSRRGSSQSGSKPTEAVISFVKQLARR